ncbi:MAG: hypothetical protein HS111_11825 [Kofleriaceae bacterium]|nr:hypothetical protein [Kofleriaceae bacterium]
MRASSHRLSLPMTAALAASALVACGGAEPGTLEVTVYGEDFIEVGIPASEVVDGWSVTFDRFLVSIGGATAQAGHGADELSAPGYRIFDLAQPSGGTGYLLATLDAPAGTYDHFGYVIRPDASATAGNASAADVDALKAAGHSVRVVGTATRGAETIEFDWGFALTIVHSHCEVAHTVDGDTVTIEATIHGDHLLYDDAVAAEPDLAFDLIADADGADGSTPDGRVTPAELAAQDITGQERYQVGSLDIDDLWGFISHQVGTLGHVDGEGHCEDIQVSGT